jgi:arabinogalactan endo-1,4-beta-galactosidase
MKKKGFYLSCALGGLAAIALISQYPLASTSLSLVKAGSSPYTLSLTSDNAPSGLTNSYNTTALSASSRYTSFSVLGAKSKSGAFCTLESGADTNYIQNVDTALTPYGLTGVSSIVVSFSGGDTLKLYAAYSQNDSYACVYEFSTSLGKTSLPSCPFRFYKFVNESGSAVDVLSLSFTYSCATSSSYFSIANVTSGAVNSKTSLTLTTSGTSDKTLSFYYYDSNIVFAGNATDGYTVEGLLAGSYTTVFAVNSSGLSTSFTVKIAEEYYSSSDSSTPAYYDQSTWRDSISSLTSNGASSSFAKGIDASEVQYNEEKGAKYYARSYEREDVYKLLKDNGVTLVRLRVWVNPYTTASTPVSYGGGVCDSSYLLKMAARAHRVGLGVMVDFHLSDFWTHPSQSVLPKAWTSYTSSQIASAISSHITSVLTSLKAIGVTPKIVQIGNEVSDGLYISYPSSTNAATSYTGDGAPYYIQNKVDYGTDSTVSGYLWQINSSTTNQTTRIKNFRAYLAAGCAAVRAFDSSIKIAIHYAKDLSSDQSFPANWFNNYLLSSSYGSALDFDIVGLSYYPYYHGTIANLASAISNLKAKNSTLAAKEYMVLETSFPFTTQYQYGASAWTANTYPTSGSDVTLHDYAITTSCVAVQAKFYNDLVSQLVSSGASGMFLWGACWTPVSGSGWAGSGTKNTWANQGLFTYGGYLTDTLAKVFNQ